MSWHCSPGIGTAHPGDARGWGAALPLLRTGTWGLGWKRVGWLAPGCHRSACADLIQSDDQAEPRSACRNNRSSVLTPGGVRGAGGGQQACSSLPPLPARCKGFSPWHLPKCSELLGVPGGTGWTRCAVENWSGSVPSDWWCWRRDAALTSRAAALQPAVPHGEGVRSCRLSPGFSSVGPGQEEGPAATGARERGPTSQAPHLKSTACSATSLDNTSWRGVDLHAALSPAASLLPTTVQGLGVAHREERGSCACSGGFACPVPGD